VKRETGLDKNTTSQMPPGKKVLPGETVFARSGSGPSLADRLFDGPQQVVDLSGRSPPLLAASLGATSRWRVAPPTGGKALTRPLDEHPDAACGSLALYP
jgi:hypothetical protein